MIKLFVDDLRECPDGWHVARNVTEAIRVLATQIVDEVSLDHDIMEHFGKASLETFEAVAYFLRELKYQGYKIKVRIHTSNVVAGARMAKILDIPYHNEIYNQENYK